MEPFEHSLDLSLYCILIIIIKIMFPNKVNKHCSMGRWKSRHCFIVLRVCWYRQANWC